MQGTLADIYMMVTLQNVLTPVFPSDHYLKFAINQVTLIENIQKLYKKQKAFLRTYSQPSFVEPYSFRQCLKKTANPKPYGPPHWPLSNSI